MDEFLKAFGQAMIAEQDKMAANRKALDGGQPLDFKRGVKTGYERGFIVAGYHLACMHVAGAMTKAFDAMEAKRAS